MRQVKSKSTRRPYHHGDLKNALLDTALKQIAEHGAQTLSLREVARAAGVTHGAAYRHFRNKESLLACIAEQGFRQLSATMRAAAQAAAPDSLDMLRATGMGYLDFATSHASHLQVMFGGLIKSHEPYPGLLEASQAAYQDLQGAVRRGIQSGRLAAPSEQVAAVAAWSLVHGLALLAASGQLRMPDGSGVDQRQLAQAVLLLQQRGYEAPG